MSWRRCITSSGIAILAASIFLTPAPALATLGQLWRGAPNALDQVVGSQSEKSTKSYYSVHTYSDESDVIVVEYANSLGVVFAVQWSGPGLPNLKNLLSERYLKYLAENSGQFVTRSIGFNKDGFVFRTLGKMRSFRGYFYDTSLLPPNFDVGVFL